MEKYQPRVSVVTVVYNDVKHIEGTILSVTRQNYPNLEYIVIDGGSTDGTVDVIKKYADKISYWVSEKDDGLYYAMNKAITVATGEWILFRNCGDYFSSLSDISKVFNGESYDGVDIIHGNCVQWDKDCYYIEEPWIIKPNGNTKRMFIKHPATFVRTSIQKAMPFDVSYKIAADYNFIYNCYKKGKVFKYVPYILAIFDKSGGLSTDNSNYARIENYRVRWGDKINLRDKLELYCINSNRSMKKFIRLHFIPRSFLEQRRLSQGKKLWTDKFTLTDMIRQAINNKNTDFK